MALTTLDEQVETLLPPIPAVTIPSSTEEVKTTSEVETPVELDAETLFTPLEESVKPVVSEVEKDVQVADLKLSSEIGTGAIAHDHDKFKKDVDALISSETSETETSDSDILDATKGYFSRIGTTYGNLGKSVVTGLGKDNILALVELAPLAVEYGLLRAPTAGLRTISEGIKATMRLMPDAWEVYISELATGEKNANIFSYDPILNTQDQVDNFLSHQIPELLNAGLDVAAALGYTSAKDVDVREFPGAYNKYKEHIFKAYEVPENQRNVATDYTKLVASIAFPYATIRKALGRDSIEFIQKKYLAKKKQATSMQADLDSLVIKRSKEGKTIVSKKSVVKKDRLAQQALLRARPKVRQDLAGLTWKARHFARANSAVPLYKRYNRGVKSILKDEALIAGVAAGTMLTTENLMEGTSLEEYKSLSFLPALIIAPLLPGLLVKAFDGVDSARHLAMAHIEGGLNGNTDKARYHVLRSKNYSVEQIDKMDEGTQVQLAIQDKGALLRARETATYLETLRKSNDPNDNQMYADIAEAVNISTQNAKLLTRDLKEDVANGFLKQSDVKNLSNTFPVLIDQVALLSGLQTARLQIINSVNSGGILRKKKMFMLNDLDRIQVVLDQQTIGLTKSLLGIKNSLNKKLGVDETEASAAGILYSNLKREVDRITQSGFIAKQDIATLKNSSSKVSDPSNTAEVRRSVNKVFGNDETNPATWVERGNEPILAQQLAGDSLVDMGRNQQKSITSSVERIYKTSNENFDAAFNVKIPLSADELLIYHSEFLENHLDSVAIFKPLLRTLLSQENRLITIARQRGLENLKNRFEGNSKKYFDSLIDMSIRFDNVLTPNKNHANTITQYNADYTEDAVEAIESLERELLKRPFYTDVDGKKVIKSINSKGIEDMIIPTSLDSSEIHKLRSTIMTTHHKKKTNGDIDFNQAKFAQTFDSAVSKMFENLEKQVKVGDTSSKNRNIQLALDQRELIKKANTFYKNAIGKTFNQRLGVFVKTNSAETNYVPIKELADLDDLFDSFIDSKGSGFTQKAEQFRIMFSKLDEEGIPIPDTLDIEAVFLLKQAIRRFMVKGSSNELGLKSLDDGFINNFLIDTKNPASLNILKNVDKEELTTFFSARQAEQTVDYGKVPFIEYAETMDSVFTSLSKDKQKAFVESLFGDVAKAGTDYDKLFNVFIKTPKDLWKAEQNFHYGREPLNFYKLKYEESKLPEDLEEFRKLEHQEKVLNNKMAKETLDVAGVEPALSANVLEIVGPKIRLDATKSKSPINILLETFEDSPKQQKDIRTALKGMFTEYVADSSFSFTSEKTYRPPSDIAFKTKSNINGGDISLGTTIDIETFANILNKNEDALKILWADDPEQLARLSRIFRVGIVSKGTAQNVSKTGEVGTQTTIGAGVSRVYSISRGVVSPRYVATELAIKQAQISNSNSILQTIMDPNTTKIVDTVMQDVRSNSVTKDTAKKVRDLGLTFFFLQMGEDDPTTIKDEAWVRTRLEFLARGMRATESDMENNTLSLEEDEVSVQEENTSDSFGETFSLE